MEWIIACNPDEYDVIGAFDALDTIDWKQSTNIEVDDIVYIYVTKPVRAIRFKCVVKKVNMKDPEIDDIGYVIDDTGYAEYGRYMQLLLLEKYDTPKLSFHQLQTKRCAKAALRLYFRVNRDFDRTADYPEARNRDTCQSIRPTSNRT